MTDLEMWLIGTPDQVTAALTTLATAGRIAGASKPEPLYGTDAGRIRRYVRLSVATTVRTGHAVDRAAAAADRQTVIDLASRRTA